MGLATEAGMIDPYETLGLTKEATASAIRTAYKKLALRYHPDKHRDESQKAEMSQQFQKIQEAYEILNDPRRKQDYDESCEIEAEIREKQRRASELKKDKKRKEEERKKREMERRAAAEYEQSKRREDVMIAEALRTQQARKMAAAAQTDSRRGSTADEKPFHKGTREEEKRKKAEKKLREEEMARREREELDRLHREEEHKRRDVDQERRDRDRRKDRGDKKMSQTFEFDEDPYGGFEQEHVRPGDRGRASKERLRSDPLAVPREPSPRPRDNSRQRGGRDRSRNREKERDHSRHREGPRDKERERVRQQMYENAVPGAPRRSSSDPVYDSNYLRTPQPQPYNNSPPSYSHFSGPAPGTRSPPESPEIPYVSPQGPPGSYGTPSTKGRARDRDRAVPRKHQETPAYVPRESTFGNGPEELAHSMPGTRDSGYCSSSNKTPLKNLDTRNSSERVTMEGGKKYKVVYVECSDTDSEEDKSHKAGSSRGGRHREEPHPSPRHASASAADSADVFEFMVSGSNAHSYPADKTFYSNLPKASTMPHHTRHHSNNQSPPKVNIETAGYAYVSAGGHPSRHHNSREVPPVGGGGGYYRDTPSMNRHATWTG